MSQEIDIKYYSEMLNIKTKRRSDGSWYAYTLESEEIGTGKDQIKAIKDLLHQMQVR